MTESIQPQPMQPEPGTFPQGAQPTVPARHSRRALVAAAGVGAVVAGAAAFGVGYATAGSGVVDGHGAVAAPAYPSQQGAARQTDYSTATAAQQVGVVDIDTVLGYSGGRAAGTGMVLTADGEILTNNHVVRGATSIQVTVVTTGRSYTASVVGTDPTDDVAVLRLDNASGLQTAHLGTAADLQVGDTVTGVGNAGGAGGTPSAASGQVTALDQTITAADEDGSNAETLDGLIQTDAAIQAGDSGGPLYDTAGEVVGMDTAASTSTTGFGSGAGAGTAEGYAIPIEDAVSIAHRIESGPETDTIHLGNPAFLGISIAGGVDTGGVLVGGVVDSGPAAQAGIAAGDVITALDGTATTSPGALQSALATRQPGDRVAVAWTDGAGSSHRATVTLATGPAD